MKTVIAIDITNTIELVSSGNHHFWTRPAKGANRLRYMEFAGRTLDDALKSLAARVNLGY